MWVDSRINGIGVPFIRFSFSWVMLSASKVLFLGTSLTSLQGSSLLNKQIIGIGGLWDCSSSECSFPLLSRRRKLHSLQHVTPGPSDSCRPWQNGS